MATMSVSVDRINLRIYAVYQLCCATLAYELCGFPTPANLARFMTECSMAYLGSPIYCDPDAILSRTEAELLRHYLKCSGKLSSCFCHRQQVITENCTEIKIAILLLKYDSERNAIHTDRACLRYLTERFDRDLLSNSFKFPFMVWKTWMKHSYCYIDLFITLLLGNAINSSINSVEGYFLPFVTPKFMLRYPEMETDPVISALSTSHKTLWFNHLINYTSRLCGVILQQQQGKMLHGEHRMNFVQQSQSFLLPFPPWIAMIFFCAILAVPLIICAEKLFSATRRCHPRSSSEPMPIHLRHRWRAGFAGGMLAENMRHKKESKALVAKSARSHSAAFHVQAGKPPFSNPAL